MRDARPARRRTGGRRHVGRCLLPLDVGPARQRTGQKYSRPDCSSSARSACAGDPRTSRPIVLWLVNTLTLFASPRCPARCTKMLASAASAAADAQEPVGSRVTRSDGPEGCAEVVDVPAAPVLELHPANDTARLALPNTIREALLTATPPTRRLMAPPLVGVQSATLGWPLSDSAAPSGRRSTGSEQRRLPRCPRRSLVRDLRCHRAKSVAPRAICVPQRGGVW